MCWFLDTHHWEYGDLDESGKWYYKWHFKMPCIVYRKCTKCDDIEKLYWGSKEEIEELKRKN